MVSWLEIFSVLCSRCHGHKHLQGEKNETCKDSFVDNERCTLVCSMKSRHFQKDPGARSTSRSL